MTLPRLTTSVQVESRAWRAAWPSLATDIRMLIKAAGPQVLYPAGLRGGVVAIVLADDQRLRALNGRFRGKDKPTNVLSFPDADEPLGGLALSFETISREAGDQGKSFVNHAKHMILHGFLHLLGYDHMSRREARLMEGLETAILAGMGIPDPYEAESRPRA